jgi:proline iminopeptidase
VSDPGTDLTNNTTAHLVADIEHLREELGIERWLVCGVSWGVTLGLTNAERYPDRVTELVFVSVTMTRATDVHWLCHEAGRLFPLLRPRRLARERRTAAQRVPALRDPRVHGPRPL